jgi:diadenosine tetraphosphate (Ap4A) HIT family hydrolase
METASKKQSRLPSKIAFGNQVVASSLAFLSAKNAIGIVDNQIPITYNCIILPKRNVSKFSDLNENEAIDLFMFAQKTAKIMESDLDYVVKEGRSVELVLRDGIGAGDGQDQTCIWLVPRRKGERVTFSDGCA